ncbi:MAG: class I SAM-dependent methyltransferase [Methylocystis sp.]
MNTVSEQYNSWVYPQPINDMRGAISNGSYLEIGDPYLYQPRFWPNKRNIENLDILIAGCGSIQAAYYACRNPNWNVTGIDVSDASLAHQHELKKRHGLSNLSLHKCDLYDLKSLGNSYDFIVSTGVIHCLPDPVRGLSTLKEALRPDGVINLMVYGQTLRLGVYMMQEVFSLLNCQQSREDVQIVKETIKSLHPDHVLQRYVRSAPDLNSDSGIVDTFLPSRDRAYYVKDIYELTRDSGLEFLTWCDPIEYSIEASIPSDHPLRKKLESVKPEIAEHVCDLLTQLRGTHRWAAAHPGYVKKSIIPFENDLFFDCIVSLHSSATIIQKADNQQKKNMLCLRRNIPFEINYELGEILERADGIKTLAQIFSELALTPDNADTFRRHAQVDFRSLWKQGHLNIFFSKNTL